MAESKQEIKVSLEKANLYEINPQGKYLIVMPKDANLRLISEAISTFFEPAKVFVLAVNDVTEIKIAELVAGKE